MYTFFRAMTLICPNSGYYTVANARVAPARDSAMCVYSAVPHAHWRENPHQF